MALHFNGNGIISGKAGDPSADCCCDINEYIFNKSLKEFYVI